MGVRERVHRAIASATADADKTLSETPHATEHERLTMLLDGWFSGLAEALEELAVEIDLLRASRTPDAVPEPALAPEDARDRPAAEDAEDGDEDEDRSLDEEALAERARASREKTEAVRAETHGSPNDETNEEE